MSIVRAAEVRRRVANVPAPTRHGSARSTFMKIVYKPFAIGLGTPPGIIAGSGSTPLGRLRRMSRRHRRRSTPRGRRSSEWRRGPGEQRSRVTRAAVDRHGAEGFRHLTGFWPGEQHQEKSQATEVAGSDHAPQKRPRASVAPTWCGSGERPAAARCTSRCRRWACALAAGQPRSADRAVAVRASEWPSGPRRPVSRKPAARSRRAAPSSSP